MIWIKMSRFILAFLLCFFSSILSADVYRCVGSTGAIEFRDSPCEGYLESQQIIPYPTVSPNENSAREDKRVFRKIQNYVDKERKKRIREEIRLEKQAEKEFKKEERLAEKCHRAKEKVSDVEFELRMGCKVQRCNRLRRELAKQESKQREYCQPG